jgi:hypothetical protein
VLAAVGVPAFTSVIAFADVSASAGVPALIGVPAPAGYPSLQTSPALSGVLSVAVIDPMQVTLHVPTLLASLLSRQPCVLFINNIQ